MAVSSKRVRAIYPFEIIHQHFSLLLVVLHRHMPVSGNLYRAMCEPVDNSIKAFNFCFHFLGT